MLGRIICLFLGLALMTAGLFGKRFHSGLSVKIETPEWQGRSWLVISGSLVLLAALGGLIGNRFEGARRFGERIFLLSDVVYELFGGIVFGFVGLLFLFSSRERVDLYGKLLGLAGIFVSLILIGDIVLKLGH